MAAPNEHASVSVGALEPPGLEFEPFLSPYVLFALVLALIFSSVRSYARSTRPLSRSRRIALGFIRAVAAGVVVLCLSRPVLVQAKGLQEKGLCFLALDRSSSMNVRDAPGSRSRWGFAGNLFAQQQASLAELAKRFEIRRLLFDAVTREADLLPGEDASDTERPDGRATDLTKLLERIATESGGTSCAGALVISDGRHNAPQDPTSAARVLQPRDGSYRTGVPLYVIGVGQEATPEDYCELSVKWVHVPERAFMGSRVALHIEIESNLSAPATAPLTVTINGEKIHEETLALPAGIETRRVELSYTPSALGMHRVTAVLAALPKESNINNNTRTAYFRVYRSKLGIWYVEGAVRKEFGALRSALETAPNLRLNAVNAFTRRSGPDPSLLPQTEEEWSDLRLVILGDLGASRFERTAFARLAKFVEDGGAVLMIGGIENFGAGGWSRTPLAAALPVEMNTTDGALEGPLPLHLTADGASHPATKLAEDPAQSANLWESLPPMPDINVAGTVKPAAKVLLRAGPGELLVVQEYGKGRSAVFTGGTTWQWILKGGQADAHKRFWRNLATWLTRSEYRDADRVVFVDTDRLQYVLGEEAVLSAHVQETEAAKSQLGPARIVATLEQDDGTKRSWEMGRGIGDFSARNVPLRPGSYTFKTDVIGTTGAILGHDAVGFQVDVPDVENDNPKANLQLLRRLATLTGGAYYDSSNAAEAFQQLLKRPTGFSKTIRESHELWNHWSLFLAFIALLTLEWGLRKKWGLI